MHREPEGLVLHASCGTGDENIMSTCREACNNLPYDMITELAENRQI